MRYLAAALVVVVGCRAALAADFEALAGSARLGLPSAYVSLPPQAFGSDRALIETLREGRSPEERAAAAAALMAYVLRSSDARTALLEALADRREEDMVRRAAAKSLSAAVSDSRSREALLEAARNSQESEDLRAICLKAMYRMTNSGAQKLLDALEDSSESIAVRKAAAWGLFKAVGRVEVRRALREAATDSREDASLREEALKSLFGATNTVEVRDIYVELAQDRREEASLRAVATLGLVSRTNESSVRGILEELAQKDSESEVRLAALKALSRVVDESVAERFHLDHVGAGLWRDPLLYE